RPRAKDYDEDVKQILTIAAQIFRCHVSTINAFPENSLEMQWAHLAWGRACRELGIQLAASPSLTRIITARTFQCRSELKSKIKSLVESSYGFSKTSAPEAILQNRVRAENLKFESAYVYEEPALGQRSHAERKGIYRNPIIQKAVNAMWFVNKNDEGVVYRDFFEPFAIEALAFVLTAIHCGIDEWGTGVRRDIQFTVKDYESIYETHLRNLDNFDNLCEDAHEVLLDLRKALHREARYSHTCLLWSTYTDTCIDSNLVPRMSMLTSG
ncbi:uncharacterized protein B0H18DRAFT_876831, partial [Fomitopsis serialis]|uniref:uncharacterized protein n=1 Tax=Fomitopsis serialis TaxID=139415 RepID=UPI0020083755